MPVNMERAGMSYKKGGSKKKKKMSMRKYNIGGDRDPKMSMGDGGMGMTAREMNMESMAKGGGLKGMFMNGGGVMDGMMGQSKVKKAGYGNMGRRSRK
tara:strand:+ start:746 stop:1039 length:294 start_codon:yes stop_codon:yes gene_type:complete